MKRESIVFAIAGTCFGLIVGWIIGSQQAVPAAPRAVAAAAPSQQVATTTAPAAGSGQAAVLDENKVRALTAAAKDRPQDAVVRAELGNAFFDAERYQDAITWYQQALAIDARNVDVSTDLGVCYYYLNQPDKALQQFDHSLSIEPKHAKTLLNMGIVRAFGKQDLEGAATVWQQVVQLAPESPEGRAAKQALDSMKSAHPDVGGSGASKGTAGE